jgi:hypothetical protein
MKSGTKDEATYSTSIPAFPSPSTTIVAMFIIIRNHPMAVENITVKRIQNLKSLIDCMREIVFPPLVKVAAISLGGVLHTPTPIM